MTYFQTNLQEALRALGSFELIRLGTEDLGGRVDERHAPAIAGVRRYMTPSSGGRTPPIRY